MTALPRPRLAIRKVETIPLRIPFGTPFTMAAPHEPKREHVDVLIVKIIAEDGTYGLGETQAWRRQGSGETLPALVRNVNDQFVPRMVGRAIGDLNAIMAELDAAMYGSLYAQAAVGDALYDLMAKLVGMPLWQLFGGKCRERIPVGLPLSITGSTTAMIEAAERAYQAGYRHIRVKIGLEPREDLKNIAALRKHFGDKIVLRADANGGMSFTDALWLLPRLEEFDLDLLEQPVPGWDLDGMARLSAACRIPLSADESLTTTHALVEIIRKRAASAMQTKVGKNGGAHYIRQLWTIADAAGIGIFPGNHPSTGINVAVVTHLAAAWPGRLLVGDYQAGLADMIAEDILQRSPRIAEGNIIVSDEPGLGVELDEARIHRYRLDV